MVYVYICEFHQFHLVCYWWIRSYRTSTSCGFTPILTAIFNKFEKKENQIHSEKEEIPPWKWICNRKIIRWFFPCAIDVFSVALGCSFSAWEDRISNQLWKDNTPNVGHGDNSEKKGKKRKKWIWWHIKSLVKQHEQIYALEMNCRFHFGFYSLSLSFFSRLFSFGRWIWAHWILSCNIFLTSHCRRIIKCRRLWCENGDFPAFHHFRMPSNWMEESY